MGRILLVRHGQASLTSDDYDQLSPLGLRQSTALGRWLAARHERFDVAVSGSLRRHRQTAEGCLAELGPTASADLRIDADFDEYSHHDVFASQKPALADRATLGALMRSSENPQRVFQVLFAEAFDGWVNGRNAVPGALTWAAFRERCMTALTRVADDCGRGRTAVVFSSGGAIAAMCQHLLGTPDARVAELHFPLFNGSLTRILCQPGRISLSAFNLTSHLEPPAAVDGLMSYR